MLNPHVPSSGLVHPGYNYSIHVANGQELNATMSGTLQVNLLVNGKPLEGKFSNTLLIPELSMTLISIWNLTGSHHQIVFKDDWAEVITKFTGKLVAKAVLGHGGIYIIQTHQPPEHSTHLTKSMNINVFHCWLGHLGFDNVCKLISENMMEDVQFLTGELKFCNACVQGMAHRLPLPSGLRTSAPELLAPPYINQRYKILHHVYWQPLLTKIYLLPPF